MKKLVITVATITYFLLVNFVFAHQNKDHGSICLDSGSTTCYALKAGQTGFNGQLVPEDLSPLLEEALADHSTVWLANSIDSRTDSIAGYDGTTAKFRVSSLDIFNLPNRTLAGYVNPRPVVISTTDSANTISVWGSGSSNVVVRDLEVRPYSSNNCRGVYVWGTASYVTVNNLVVNRKNDNSIKEGIEVWGGTGGWTQDITISNNRVQNVNNSIGIHVMASGEGNRVKRVNISNNILTGCQRGISLESQSGHSGFLQEVKVHDNKFSNYSVYALGFYNANSSNNPLWSTCVHGNIFYDAPGVKVQTCGYSWWSTYLSTWNTPGCENSPSDLYWLFLGGCNQGYVPSCQHGF